MNDEVHFWHTDTHEYLLQIHTIILGVAQNTWHAQNTQNKFAYLCNISRKTWGMKLTFCLHINEVFCKMIVSLWVCIVRHTQSTQNNKFTIFLQYLQENQWKWFFACRYKLKRFLQIDIIILDMCGQACRN